MKKVLTFVAACIFFHSNVVSQGLIFNADEFSKRKAIGVTRGTLPPAVSFKKYTPIPYPQAGNTCVAQSFATARTVLAAKKLGWTDKNKITAWSFSPYYIYYRNKLEGDLECNGGLMIEATAKDVLDHGFAPIIDVEYPNYYPFTGNVLCVQEKGEAYPPSMSEDEDIAANYKVDEIYRVSNVQQIKTALAAGMPVVVCLHTPPSFQKLKTALWLPQPTDKLDTDAMGHAVLAIGYDNNKFGGAIEIMNSWGDKWGDKSFVWVRYKDYLKWFFAGYAFESRQTSDVPSTKTNSSPSSNSNIRSTKVTINRSAGNKNYTTDFNNEEYLKAFKKR